MYTRIRKNINLKWKEFVLSNYSQERWIITLKVGSKKGGLSEKQEGLSITPSIITLMN